MNETSLEYPARDKTFASTTERNIQILQMAMEYPCQLDKIADAFLLTEHQIRKILIVLGFPCRARYSHRKALIIEYLRNGYSVEEIASHFELSLSRAHRIIYDEGYKPSQVIREKKIERAKELRKNGETYTRIGQQIGCSADFISSHIGANPLLQKRCEWCGNSYRQRKVTQKYCSSECQIKAKNKKVAFFMCKECGRTFGVNTGRRNTSNSTCSQFCMGLNQKRLLATRNIEIKRLAKTGMSAKNIASMFELSPSSISQIINYERVPFPPLGWAIDKPLKTVTARGRRLIRQRIMETRKAYQEWQEQKGGGG